MRGGVDPKSTQELGGKWFQNEKVFQESLEVLHVWWINIWLPMVFATFDSTKKVGLLHSLHGSSCSTLTGRELFQGIFPGSDLRLQSLELTATSAFPRPNYWKFHLNQPLILRGFRSHNPNAHADDWNLRLFPHHPQIPPTFPPYIISIS